MACCKITCTCGIASPEHEKWTSVSIRWFWTVKLPNLSARGTAKEETHSNFNYLPGISIGQICLTFADSFNVRLHACVITQDSVCFPRRFSYLGIFIQV